MIVGILREIKAEENRVSMTPGGVEVMTQNGHTVLVEKKAGSGSGTAWADLWRYFARQHRKCRLIC